MSFKLSKNGGGDFTPHPETEGLVRAVIVDVTELKKQVSQFGERDVFKLVYESEVIDEANKRPFCIWSFPYTPSLNEKANFRKDLKKIRGRDIDRDEEREFDPETLIGHPVQIIIKHEQKGDKTYAQITHVQPHKGPDPLKPSGKFTREKDREKNAGGAASYQKAAGTSSDDAPSRADWQRCKVHVGKNKGLDLGDLEEDAVRNLLDKWLPEHRANQKPTADDKRLAAALEEAAVILEEPAY
jgi:hypothetical protein